MRLLYVVSSIPAFLGMGYLIFFIRRLLTEVLNIRVSNFVTLLIVAVAFALSVPAIDFFRVWAVGYYYFIAACLVFDIISLFIKNDFFKKAVHTGLISAIVVGLLIGYGYWNMNHVVKTDFNVSTNKNVKLDILQISDLHLGQSINPQQLEGYVKKMNQLHKDYVFLTGDIFDEATKKTDMVKACKILSSLKSEKGIYYVYGNHDDQKYGYSRSGNTDIFNHEDIRKELEKNHINVLEDKVIEQDNVVIIGRADASYQRETSEKLLKSVNKKKYVIVLDHQPLDMDENVKNGSDLQLSGHTHGGQIWPMGTVQALLTKTMRYGKKTIGNSTIITSSGIAGWGYPIKIGAPSEYAYIKVR